MKITIPDSLYQEIRDEGYEEGKQYYQGSFWDKRFYDYFGTILLGFFLGFILTGLMRMMVEGAIRKDAKIRAEQEIMSGCVLDTKEQ